MSDDYEIRAYRAGDEDSILRSFNLVFGMDNPDFRPRTLAEWRWAYADNPAGHRVWVAMHAGDVAAHYAGYPYRVRIEGQRSSFSQIVDSYVHPDHRRGLKRPGLFVRTGLEYLAATTGPGRDVVTFGWPIEEANRLGERYFGYEAVRSQELLRRETGPGAIELPDDVELLESFDDSVTPLYERCARDWGASVIRDAAYLTWRYTNHPKVSYRAYGIRRGGDLAGMFVYRLGDWPSPQTALLMDWLVPADEPELATALHDAFLVQARVDGAELTAALFPEWSPWFDLFQESAWLACPTNYITVGRQATLYDMHYLRHNWWYQLGETDFV